MTGTGDSIPQAPKGPYPGCAGFSGEIPQPPARMISPETARGMTLHSRWGYGLPLPVEWILRFPVSVLILLTHYALASQLMWIFPSLSRSRTSRLSMTDIVTSNSSKISDCSFTSPVLMNSLNLSYFVQKHYMYLCLLLVFLFPTL